MSEPRGEWNLDTLKVYFDSRLESQERAVAVALTAATKSAEATATGVAANLASEVNRLSNEFSSLNDTMQGIKDIVVGMQGRKLGISVSGKVLATVLGSVGGLAVLVGFVYKVLFRV